MKNWPVRLPQLLAALALLSLLFLAVPLDVAHAGGEPQAACSGSYYTVTPGDTWSVISRRVGITVAELKRANPQAVRGRDIIFLGERLCIPARGPAPTLTATPTSAPTSAATGGYWVQVKQGDTWTTISRETGVPVPALMEANPGLVNARMWLYIGQRVWVPDLANATISPAPTQPVPASVTPLPTAGVPLTLTVEAAATAVPTTAPATAVPTVAPTAASATVAPATAAPAASPTAAATSAPAPSPAVTPAESPLPPRPADCPETLADYDAAIARFLNNRANTVEGLNRSLTLCRVAQEGEPAALTANITGPQSGDVVVVINDRETDEFMPTGALLVFHRGAQGYTLAHRRVGQGVVALIEARDINADRKFDLVTSDTFCGAHTCFGTLFVESWDGRTYADWIEGEPAIAEPVYTVKDVGPEGQGDEIRVYGGVIGSVGAGPQRAWTETYISTKGEPYKLIWQVYDASNCLYHKIVDANHAFDAWALDGFDAAVEAYQAALAVKNPQACGRIKDEVKTLQDFARFRLVVAQVAGGNATEALALAPTITHAGLKKAVTAFMASYAANSSVIQACRDTTKVAEADPTTWQFLADWGYANPSFTAQELCPLN